VRFVTSQSLKSWPSASSDVAKECCYFTERDGDDAPGRVIDESMESPPQVVSVTHEMNYLFQEVEKLDHIARVKGDTAVEPDHTGERPPEDLELVSRKSSAFHRLGRRRLNRDRSECCSHP
jgi:hypothetical protein